MTETEYKKKRAAVVRKLKKAHIPMVEEETGISGEGLRKIADGRTKRPHQTTIEKLVEYFGVA